MSLRGSEAKGSKRASPSEGACMLPSFLSLRRRNPTVAGNYQRGVGESVIEGGTESEVPCFALRRFEEDNGAILATSPTLHRCHKCQRNAINLLSERDNERRRREREGGGVVMQLGLLCWVVICSLCLFSAKEGILPSQLRPARRARIPFVRKMSNILSKGRRREGAFFLRSLS